MSQHNPVEKNFFDSGFDIYLNEFYYIAYSDTKTLVDMKITKSMTEAEFKQNYGRYMAITQWPDIDSKYNAINELPPDQNPNYIKISGEMLILMTENGFVPQFDKNFLNSRKLIMIPIDAYEFYGQYSKAGK